MVDRMTTATPRNSAILSRDVEGGEHLLRVQTRAGLIAIEDGEMTRVLSPVAACALVHHLLHALGTFLPVRPGSGPLSGSF